MQQMGPAQIVEYFWPEWRIVRQIGRGSFGTVFECVKADGVGSFFSADDMQLGDVAMKSSAVKVISVPDSDSQIAEMRAEGMPEESAVVYFRQIAEGCIREIKTMESLKNCPNVVYIEDFKIARKPDGIGWVILIRMELLKSLPEHIAAHRMTEREILKLGMDICRALEDCRKKNIIHRDIKPGNIMLNENGDFKLADFGIARELDKGEASMSNKGTYSYMAPEMEMRQHYDSRVDLYALGIVLYQLLNNNRAPLVDTSAPMVTYEQKIKASMRRISGEMFAPPLYGSALTKNAVMKACAYRADDRFRTAGEMMQALAAAMNALPADAAVSGNTPVPQRKGEAEPSDRQQTVFAGASGRGSAEFTGPRFSDNRGFSPPGSGNPWQPPQNIGYPQPGPAPAPPPAEPPKKGPSKKIAVLIPLIAVIVSLTAVLFVAVIMPMINGTDTDTDPAAQDAANEKYTTGNYVNSTDENVRVRSSYSKDAPKIASLKSNAYIVVTEVYEDTSADKAQYRWWGKVQAEGQIGWAPLFYLTNADMKTAALSDADIDAVWQALEGCWRTLDKKRVGRFFTENGSGCFTYGELSKTPAHTLYTGASAEGDLQGLICVTMHENASGGGDTELYLDLSEMAEGRIAWNFNNHWEDGYYIGASQ